MSADIHANFSIMNSLYRINYLLIAVIVFSWILKKFLIKKKV